MKFECKTSILQSTVFQVVKARSKSSAHPNLQDIHLELDDHLLTLRATNLELVCEKSIAVKGIQNGKCLIKGEIFSKILTTFTKTDTSIVCELIEGVFIISSGKDIIEIKISNYEPFLNLPLKGEEVASFKKETFISLLRDVSFCSATTDIKPDIASVYLYNKEDVVYAVATDSYRLAESSIHNISNTTFSILLPQKYINDIISILDQENETINLYQSEHTVTFEVGSLTLAVHVILGQFPDYKQLFPAHFTTTTTVQKEVLQKTLALSTLFTENYTTTKFTVNKNEIIIESKSELLGSMHYSIPCIQTGEEIEVYYNTRYFLDVLPHIEGNEIIISFTTKNRPGFIKGNKRDTFTYLIMPVTR